MTKQQRKKMADNDVRERDQPPQYRGDYFLRSMLNPYAVWASQIKKEAAGVVPKRSEPDRS